ncbi:putative pentatricopeptide repeat-containing protein At2g01510 [Amaranthus tricolor]|uniref:putative pentatricopeptide repeat-containing protein At2g01510 n=1 Tax=Amaranthus tricolor TaxID=29722 RepID=UPI002583A376|nr:putative pentatricopeptide repeat-containing protein At2g01510 [Amaranthus tricolor]
MNQKYWTNTVHKLSSFIKSPKLQSISQNVIDARIIKTGFNPGTSRTNFQMEKLIKNGQLTMAHQLFDEMPNRNIFSVNTLISGYVKSGDLVTARHLFDRVIARNTVTWTILIGAYAKYGSPMDAFKLYVDMYSSMIMLDTVIFATLLSGFDDRKYMNQMIQVHTHVVKLGFQTALNVSNTLVDCYCKCHCLDLAFRVFDEMSERDSVTFNALLTGYANDGMNEEAVDLFLKMLKMGFRPSEFTFTAVSSTCIGLGNLFFSKQIHAFVMKTNFHWNIFVANALLDMYSKHDQVQEAEKLFDEMTEIDCVSYNIIISGNAREGKYEKSLALFQELQGTKFDRKNFPFATMLSIAADTANLEMGRQIHCHSIVTSALSELKVGNALLDMYARCGRFDEANLIFQKLSGEDTIPWTTMMSALVQNGYHEQAMDVFIEMCRANVNPDQATFASILRATASLSSLSLGKQLHALILKSGFISYMHCGSALLDMYAKCGSMRDAVKTFREMPYRNTVTWNAMISAYAQNGDGEGAIELFEEMISTSLSPDQISFLNVLTACSHCGLVDQGLRYFNNITELHKMEPRREHYIAMVDILCRNGRFGQAEKLMAEMPFKPDEVMLSSILNSCRIHKNHELAKKVAERLFEMEVKDAAAYVNMSNIYAVAGEWDKVVVVKKAMRRQGVRKAPAYSWVEINHKMHVFSANDRAHPRWKDIRRKIESLSKRMEEEGYKPDTSCALHNWDEDIRAESLKYHSERIAIAFALISTPEGSPILVFKNLRACSDCHAAIKIISKIVGREIIVRDSSRFHHFKDGHCSCRDYW